MLEELELEPILVLTFFHRRKRDFSVLLHRNTQGTQHFDDFKLFERVSSFGKYYVLLSSIKVTTKTTAATR